MHKYVFKRIILLIPIVLGVSFAVFFIMSLAPGDPVTMIVGADVPEETLEATRAELGLDKPLLVQYGKYMAGLLKGDLGSSYLSRKPVLTEYLSRFPATFKLTFWGILVAVGIGIPVGILSAVKQYSWADNISMVGALLGVSMPNFWLGLMLIILFSLKLGCLPAGGSEGLTSIILPAITLGTGQAALITRMTRSSMLEVVRQDYIRTAKAKGVNKKIVIRKHALKNALIPIVTVLGLQFGSALGGAVITETVFSWPGVGRLIIDSINRKDRPMVMGCLIMTTIFISVINLAIDILYAYLDPRIKSQYSK